MNGIEILAAEDDFEELVMGVAQRINREGADRGVPGNQLTWSIFLNAWIECHPVHRYWYSSPFVNCILRVEGRTQCSLLQTSDSVSRAMLFHYSNKSAHRFPKQRIWTWSWTLPLITRSYSTESIQPALSNLYPHPLGPLQPVTFNCSSNLFFNPLPALEPYTLALETAALQTRSFSLFCMPKSLLPLSCQGGVIRSPDYSVFSLVIA